MQVDTGEELLWIGYDDLVIAVGAVARALPIPGLAEHALGFKTIADAIQPPEPRAAAARGGDGGGLAESTAGAS